MLLLLRVVLPFLLVSITAGSNFLESNESGESRIVSKVQLKPHTNIMLGEIGVGEDDDTYRVLVDTGSGDLWLFGARNKIKKQLENDGFTHAYYKAEHSRGRPFSIKYGDGAEFSGKSGHESVVLGDELSLEWTPVAVVDKMESPGIQPTQYDGILGLGFETDNHAHTIITGMRMEEGLLKESMFSIYISEDGQDGELTFGAPNVEHYTPPLKFSELVPIDEDDTYAPLYWSVKMDEISFHGKTFGKGAGLSALVDTGCSCFGVPKKLFELIEKNTGAKRDPQGTVYHYVVNCSRIKEFPELSFTIGGQKYTFTGEEYTLRDTEKDKCGLMVIPISDNEPIVELGFSFFQKVYTEFHYYDGKIGFAAAKHGERKPHDVPSNRAGIRGARNKLRKDINTV